MQGLESRLNHARGELGTVQREGDQARLRLGLDFSDRSRLVVLRRRQVEINQALIPIAGAVVGEAANAESPEGARMADASTRLRRPQLWLPGAVEPASALPDGGSHPPAAAGRGRRARSGIPVQSVVRFAVTRGAYTGGTGPSRLADKAAPNCFFRIE